MKFSINKKYILKGLSKIQGITGRKTNLPITSTVLITSLPESKVSIVATDLETGFEGNYPAVVMVEGSLAVPSRKLFEIIKDFPAETILIDEVEKNWIQISTEKNQSKAEYHIVCMNPDQFPSLTKIEDMSMLPVNASVFKQMIENTVITGVPEDSRSHMLGLLLEILHEGGNKLIRIVSTDGHRLIKVDRLYEDIKKITQTTTETTTENNENKENVSDENIEKENPTDTIPDTTNTDYDAFFNENKGVIIPKKGMVEVIKMLEPGNNAEINMTSTMFCIKKDYEMMTIRLLEGIFPKYNDIIPKLKVSPIRLNRIILLGLLKRMSILSTEKYKGVIFNINPNMMEVTATNPEIGDSKEEIDIIYSGKPFKVAFNPKFFIDSLNSVNSEYVLLQTEGPKSPCIVKGEDDPYYLCVIMPMVI